MTEELFDPTTSQNLAYSKEISFFMCRPCSFCSGTGRTNDSSKMYSATTLESLKCEHCQGKGHKQEF